MRMLVPEFQDLRNDDCCSIVICCMLVEHLLRKRADGEVGINIQNTRWKYKLPQPLRVIILNILSIY